MGSEYGSESGSEFGGDVDNDVDYRVNTEIDTEFDNYVENIVFDDLNQFKIPQVRLFECDNESDEDTLARSDTLTVIDSDSSGDSSDDLFEDFVLKRHSKTKPC
ncbi:unnamed protein product [Brachionus calyciflorus]|uniref:Uncharacterized protein n=1 Tax=Brachionus calyciflorus TaxID=104777 RepID=A0A813MRJ9_9BILA|nr:unnamed protein product [Brachionus calyciflorus]